MSISNYSKHYTNPFKSYPRSSKIHTKNRFSFQLKSPTNLSKSVPIFHDSSKSVPIPYTNKNGSQSTKECLPLKSLLISTIKSSLS